jgi:hypothetical protein
VRTTLPWTVGDDVETWRRGDVEAENDGIKYRFS